MLVAVKLPCEEGDEECSCDHDWRPGHVCYRDWFVAWEGLGDDNGDAVERAEDCYWSTPFPEGPGCTAFLLKVLFG